MSDTIVALATAAGKGSVAMIRLSGIETFKILQRVLLQNDIEKLQHRHAVLVDFYQSVNGQVGNSFIDQCIMLTFAAPHSYTGDDLVEIHCHGGRIVPQLIIDALLSAGAKYARPGEFTQRAFLNGKMDLAQAESIEAIVSATSRSELQLAHQHFSGQFSGEIARLRAELIDLLSLLELELDFSEEDIEFADRDDILIKLHSLHELLTGLERSYRRSHLLREGIRVAIVGKPNVGKSSLLNLMLKKERAIVTEQPGTTRDIIEEFLEIRGIKFVFIDTAGIRSTEDYVEQLGIQRSESVLANADLVLFLIDQSSTLRKEDWQIRQLILNRKEAIIDKRMLLLNKSDLPIEANRNEIESFGKGFNIIEFSAKTGSHIDLLEEMLINAVNQHLDGFSQSEFSLLSVRQKDIVTKALESIDKAQESFKQNLSQEFISSELRIALGALGELIGEVSNEDILANIFSHFCIGK